MNKKTVGAKNLNRSVSNETLCALTVKCPGNVNIKDRNKKWSKGILI